jgi:hypothetical protein
VSATVTRCTDCSAPLRDTVALLFGVCDPCRARWTALAVIGTPSRIHPTDAAREASHGYSIEAELAEVGPSVNDVCERCLGSGWFDCDEWSIECDCQQVAS